MDRRIAAGSRTSALEALRALSRRTLAAATAVLIYAALLFAYVLDLTNNEAGKGDVRGWLIVGTVASVIAAALLLRFVPASESNSDGSNKPARRALILAVLSVITFVVFWTGLPFAFGVPALALAPTGRARAPQEGRGGEATAAIVLALLAITAALVQPRIGRALDANRITTKNGTRAGILAAAAGFAAGHARANRRPRER